jgi:hypothetical protein
MLYGGVAIKVDVPADGSIIRDSFEPVYSIEFHDGYLGESYSLSSLVSTDACANGFSE